MINYLKPLPTTNQFSKPFWDGCKKHELLIQKCGDCGKFIMYPKMFCPDCLSENIEWVKSKGTGKIYSFTVVHNNPPSQFLQDLPYVIAIVELDEGVRMCTNIVESNTDSLSCEQRVEVLFEDVTPEYSLPKFRTVR